VTVYAVSLCAMWQNGTVKHTAVLVSASNYTEAVGKANMMVDKFHPDACKRHAAVGECTETIEPHEFVVLS